MDNDPVTTCLGLFYDSGGASDNIGATWVCIVFFFQAEDGIRD